MHLAYRWFTGLGFAILYRSREVFSQSSYDVDLISLQCPPGGPTAEGPGDEVSRAVADDCRRRPRPMVRTEPTGRCGAGVRSQERCRPGSHVQVQLGISGAVDFPHAALADLRGDVVVAEAGARAEGHGLTLLQWLKLGASRRLGLREGCTFPFLEAGPELLPNSGQRRRPSRRSGPSSMAWSVIRSVARQPTHRKGSIISSYLAGC